MQTLLAKEKPHHVTEMENNAWLLTYFMEDVPDSDQRGLYGILIRHVGDVPRKSVEEGHYSIIDDYITSIYIDNGKIFAAKSEKLKKMYHSDNKLQRDIIKRKNEKLINYNVRELEEVEISFPNFKDFRIFVKEKNGNIEIRAYNFEKGPKFLKIETNLHHDTGLRLMSTNNGH